MKNAKKTATAATKKQIPRYGSVIVIIWTRQSDLNAGWFSLDLWTLSKFRVEQFRFNMVGVPSPSQFDLSEEVGRSCESKKEKQKGDILLFERMSPFDVEAGGIDLWCHCFAENPEKQGFVPTGDLLPVLKINIYSLQINKSNDPNSTKKWLFHLTIVRHGRGNYQACTKVDQAELSVKKRSLNAKNRPLMSP